MSIDFLKIKVDKINLFSPTIPSVQHNVEEDNNLAKSEQESFKINPVQGLKLAIERHGSTEVPQRSQTMKHYNRAKSDGMFKHQNTLQVICHKSIPSTPTATDSAAGFVSTSKITNKSNPGSLMKAKSESQFQPQSFLQIHQQIKAAISTPSSPIPPSPSVSSMKDSKLNLASSRSICDIFNSIASIPAQVIRLSNVKRGRK